ncbi:MAG: RdgB/HAM1 family non-canonical purine NTP pyrophosphatase [Clostridia bacterium]|nr:RdgB/HAM1 family non-canonical purine NTP pyrophosphatase [Clostridia bacterium]
MQKLIIATHNKGKFKEFKRMFGSIFEVHALPYNGFDGDVEETGTTYYENALLKAKFVYENTGELCIADDSGLSVTSLNGEPGLYSARYGGENTPQKVKNQMIIDRLADKTDRSAKFICCLVLYGKNGVVAVGNGEVEGKILFTEEGSGGFGYDPIFYCNELNKSFGVASEDEKNSVSHRSRAITDLLNKLKDIDVNNK